ncbi:MAG TPA: hypothetical protein VNM34_14995 [Verrucomicrobiae bacterium]|nr:hypothetical protein [Verrucomicrobiae bacterium]
MTWDPVRGVLVLDLETSSAADLRRLGARAYARHPSTEVLVLRAAYWGGELRGGEPLLDEYEWRPGRLGAARAFLEAVRAGVRVVAHNAEFELAIWDLVLRPRHGFPAVALDQWEDTQVRGLAANLPPKLEGLARALGCAVQKDKEGAKLMREMSTAEPDGRGGWRRSRDPDDLDRLSEYCAVDVRATAGCWARLQPPSVHEELVVRADARINARGVWLDREFAARLARMAASRSSVLQDAAIAASDFDLANSTAAPALKEWLARRGVRLPKVPRKRKDGVVRMTETVGAPAVSALLARADLPRDVRLVLENRAEAGKASSLAKLARADEMVCPDGRLRNSLQVYGAHTGRWASYGMQLHNLPKTRLGPGAAGLARLVVEAGDLDLLARIEDRPLSVLSQMLRGVVAAPPGRELIGADFSAIEARVVAWLAGQEDVLALLRDYDAARLRGERRQDLYEYAAEAVGSRDRQLGKVCTLALGYGMGVVKLAETAAGWGVRMTLKEFRRVQRAWRTANNAIVQFWASLQDAAHAAVRGGPGTRVEVGRVSMAMTPGCLLMVLPSGRAVRFWRPRVDRVVKRVETVDEDGNIVTVEFEGDELAFFTPGKDGASMARETTYGGKLAENATQAASRDLLADALLRLERDGYEVVLHVHDSVAAEVAAGAGDVDEFCRVVSAPPPWATDLPVAADGYRARRFRG